MKNQKDLTITILALEQKLLDPDVRRSMQQMDALLADEFVEFGKSGRVFNKEQVIAGLQKEHKTQYEILNFKTRTLADGVVLATYYTLLNEEGGKKTQSLRSSIWKMIDGRWQIVFHQGTLTMAKFTRR
jgi:hypothetical protein